MGATLPVDKREESDVQILHQRRLVVSRSNTWQGGFPYENSEEDGFLRISPVGHFPPNGYGLYDMIGNVWEWTVDAFKTPSPAEAINHSRSCCMKKTVSNAEVLVIKGRSHLCAPNYFQRYRPGARHAQQRDMATGHIGFRCIVRS